MSYVLLNMPSRMRALFGVLISALVIGHASATADDVGTTHVHVQVMHADSNPPAGVMRGHTHKSGQWMLSYRYAYLDIGGNRIGDTEVSPDTIVTTGRVPSMT